jgi:hypothetical protein
MKINTRADEPITLDGTSMEEVNDFVYLGSKITTDGDSEVDVQARISKATGAYAALRNIWRSSKISNHSKVRIFKSNVLSSWCPSQCNPGVHSTHVANPCTSSFFYLLR